MYFILSQHARERYIQRFVEPIRYDHVDECSKKECQECATLKRELHLRAIRKDREWVEQEMLGRLEVASDERSFLNNTAFVSHIHSKYGMDRRFHFLVHKGVVFVTVEDGEKYRAVLTVLPTATTVFSHTLKRVKYGHKAAG